MNCLDCNHVLANPDAVHRYCPYCGAVRVVNDAGSDVDKVGLLVGLESIGPNSGAVYATEQLAATPTKLDPLAGPHTTPTGSPWRDIFASSGTPNPETTLLRYARPQFLRSGPAEKALNVRFWRITHRHRRLFILTEGGQLWSLVDDTLDHAPTWEHSRVDGATPATNLIVSQTLLMAVSQGSNDCRIQGFDVGRCKLQFTLTVPLTRTGVAVSGGSLLVVGVGATGTPSALRYRLEELSPTSAPPPEQVHPRGMQGQQPDLRACAFAVGKGHVFLLPDGTVYRWNSDSPDCEVLWPNPNQETRVPEQPLVAFNSGAIGVLTAAKGEHWLRTFGITSEGRIDCLSADPLPHLRDSSSRLIAACNEQVYVLSHPPGQPLTIMVSDQHNLSSTRPFISLAGRTDTTVTHFQTIAWRGEPHLLLRATPNGRHTQEFWLIHPTSGAHDLILGARARSEILEGVWGAGRFWLANMEKGRIECADS